MGWPYGPAAPSFESRFSRRRAARPPRAYPARCARAPFVSRKGRVGIHVTQIPAMSFFTPLLSVQNDIVSTKN